MTSRIATALLVAATLTGCAVGQGSEPVQLQAGDVHRDLLVLDTHLDTPINFGREGWDFSAAHDVSSEIAQVDLGRMAAGNLDGGFFVIFTDQGPLTAEGYRNALDHARGRSEAIDRELAKFPDMIGLARSATEAEALTAEDKLIAFKSIENSYPIGEDLSLMLEFYESGVRMAGPVHGGANQLGDSATDDPRWNGLSPLGREWVGEMNRLGMIIDASHSSDAVLDQLLKLSQAPIILSHSSPRWAYEHPRNIDDARVRRIAANGGAVCMSSIFMSELNLTGTRGELFDQYDRIAQMSPEQQRELSRKWRALDATQPMWDVGFDRYMEALLHLIDVAGVDHVCFGTDWDGGGGIDGLMDITDLPAVTARLLEAGYSREDIGKMTGGNVLRIMRAVEAARAR
ncbi:dipeptidase [Alteriqipengyuania lutimaris]|uniref:Membrane dipeptidase n=1 Tax=Alteriqipengyuania lutimaris TaxID=1538146 RepID=A0A395LVC8_9SPHN|nr:membrane dipeptidase [Alteriqipengyuania lutimaris]MBB3032439.1 membrane dipeptidase [Alteriqipengyuania lutimaris]RDS78420.1 membrane dipeptidase [Alteriqipengyuania lutimaris]